jgi:hypothetical protein
LQILLACAPAKSVHVTVVDSHHGGETMHPTGPIESEECYGAGRDRRSHITIACTNCDIYQTVEVEYDGGQGYATLPITPCSVCHQDLCPFCDQIRCECGQIVCLHCSVTVPDGTPSGLKLCKPCAHQADPLCPACGEFARMMPRQDYEQQWFECTACGAAMDEDEIAAAQQVPTPRQQPGIERKHSTGGTFPEVA